jgi:hypothetical protein
MTREQIIEILRANYVDLPYSTVYDEDLAYIADEILSLTQQDEPSSEKGMRHIVIESTIYKVTEKQFDELEAMQEKLIPTSPSGTELELSDWIQERIPTYQKVDEIWFDFRL